MDDRKNVNNSFGDIELEASETNQQVDSMPRAGSDNSINRNMTSANSDNNPMFNSRQANNNDFQKANNPALGQRRMNSNPNNALQKDELKDQNNSPKERTQPSNAQNDHQSNANNPSNGEKQNTPNSKQTQNSNPLPGSSNNNKVPKDSDANKNSVKPKESSNKKFNPKKNIQDFAPGNMLKNAASKLGLGKNKDDKGSPVGNLVKTGIKNVWKMLPVSVKITVGVTAGGIVLLAIIIMIVIGVSTGTAIGSGLMCDNTTNESFVSSGDVMEFLCKMQEPLHSSSYVITSWAGVSDAVHNYAHAGIDFADSKNTPIYSVQAGTVIETYDGCTVEHNRWNSCGGGYGNHVLVQHGAIQIMYGHMTNGTVTVKKNDKVAKGQLIGKIGSTGHSTGYHLHFEMRKMKGSNSYSIVTDTNDYFKNKNSFKNSCGSSWEGDTAESTYVSNDGSSSSSNSQCCTTIASNSETNNYCPNGITVTGNYAGTYALDDYIERVVTAENGGANTEALKALAVAARTYTLNRTDNCNHTIPNDTTAQVMAKNASDKVKKALEDVKGSIMLYNGKYFSAEYSSFLGSCSGGTCTSTFTKVPSTKKDTFTMPSEYMTINAGHDRGLSQNGSNYMAAQGKKYDEILRFFYADGIEITGSTGSTCSLGEDGTYKKGKIWIYDQNKYHQKFCGGKPIAKNGCGPTSMAMVVSTLLNSKHDPVELSSVVPESIGCANVGYSSKFFEKAAKHYGLKYKKTHSGDEVLTALNRGDSLVVVAVKNPKNTKSSLYNFWTKGGHYMVLGGHKGRTVWVENPNRSSARNKKNGSVSGAFDFDKYIKPVARTYHIISK